VCQQDEETANTEFWTKEELLVVYENYRKLPVSGTP
jgi:hypothetical protein